MKKKFLLHPEDYAIGENEQFYADQAAKGWLLEHRGAYLSRFKRTEPQQLRYRIELSSPDAFEDTNLPDEQIALYEESGWQFVTHMGLVHVFCAPVESEAPEFYSDPRQQAATLKALRRNYSLSWLPLGLILLFNALSYGALKGGNRNALTGWIYDWKEAMVESTALSLLLLTFVIWSLYQLAHSAFCTGLLYRRLKQGQQPLRQRRSRLSPHWLCRTALAGIFILFALLSVLQWRQTHTYAMPQQPDGPYLLLSELGLTGERATMFNDRESDVTTSRSLLARQWHTYECIGQGTGDQRSYAWIYQDIYELKDARLREDFVLTQMNCATFAHSQPDFTPLQVEGLDGAWRSGRLEYIAVKGDLVYYIVCLADNTPDGGIDNLLQVLAATE